MAFLKHLVVGEDREGFQFGPQKNLPLIINSAEMVLIVSVIEQSLNWLCVKEAGSVSMGSWLLHATFLKVSYFLLFRKHLKESTC